MGTEATDQSWPIPEIPGSFPKASNANMTLSWLAAEEPKLCIVPVR